MAEDNETLDKVFKFALGRYQRLYLVLDSDSDPGCWTRKFTVVGDSGASTHALWIGRKPAAPLEEVLTQFRVDLLSEDADELPRTLAYGMIALPTVESAAEDSMSLKVKRCIVGAITSMLARLSRGISLVMQEDLCCSRTVLDVSSLEELLVKADLLHAV